MRSKEDAQDYRYFPEPDLVPVEISDEWLEEIRSRQPELRDEKMIRYEKEYGIPAYDAAIITESKRMADLFEQATQLCGKPKEVSNWLMVETMRLMKETQTEPEDLTVSPKKLAALILLVEKGTINRTVAKKVYEKIFLEDVDPGEYVTQNGLGMVQDDSLLRRTAEAVLADNPQSVADYKGGKVKAMGYLVGQTMRAMKGKADPARVNEIIQALLSKQ